MNLRKAFPDDALAIARVHVDSWRSAYRGLVPDDSLAKLDYVRGAERFRKSISSGAELVCVAEDSAESTRVVGFLALGLCPDTDIDPTTTGEIYAMYLLPEHWRRGMGRSMCREAEQLLKSQTCSQTVLWVFRR